MTLFKNDAKKIKVENTRKIKNEEQLLPVGTMSAFLPEKCFNNYYWFAEIGVSNIVIQSRFALGLPL